MKQAVERLIDIVYTTCVAPLIVSYWAGTWTLLDIYLFPDNVLLSALVSLLTGFVIMTSSYFLQDPLNRHVTPDTRVLYATISRLYCYITAFGVVCYWRGVWELIDYLSEDVVVEEIVKVVVGVTVLVLIRGFRNVLASPAVWAMDVETQSHFTVLTRFRREKISILYFPDVLFSILVISTLVVVVWRGAWQILVLTTGDMNALWWSVAKFIGANGLLCYLCVVQYPARRIAARLHEQSFKLKQIAFENTFIFILGFAAILHWQSLWSLLEILASNLDLIVAQWCYHGIGFLGLVVLRLSTSLQFPGFFVDGEFSDGLGLVITPTFYRTFCSNLNVDLAQPLPTLTSGLQMEQESNPGYTIMMVQL